MEHRNSMNEHESLELCKESLQCMEGPLRQLSLIKGCDDGDDGDDRERANSKLYWKPSVESWNPSILVDAMKQYYQLKINNQRDTKAITTLPCKDVKHPNNKIDEKNNDDLGSESSKQTKHFLERHDKTSTITPSDKSETLNIAIYARNDEGGRVTYGSKTRLKRKRQNPSTVKDVFHFGSSQSSSASPPTFSHLIKKKKTKQCYGKRRPHSHYQSPIVTTFPYPNTSTTHSNTTRQQQMSQEADSYDNALPDKFLPRQLNSTFENLEMRLPRNKHTIETKESNTTSISKSHPNELNPQNNTSVSDCVRKNEEKQIYSKQKNQTNDQQTEIFSHLSAQTDISSKQETESIHSNSCTEQQDNINLKSTTDNDNDDISQNELTSLFNEVSKNLCSYEQHQCDSPLHDGSQTPPEFARRSSRDMHQTIDLIEKQRKSHAMDKCEDTVLTQVENGDQDQQPSRKTTNNQPEQKISQNHDENDPDQDTTLIVGSSVPLLETVDNKEMSACLTTTTTEPHGTNMKHESTKFSHCFQDIPSSPSYDSFSQQSLHSEHPPPEFWITTRNINYDQELSPPESDTYCPTPPSDTNEDTLGSDRAGSRKLALPPPFSLSQESLQSEHPPMTDYSYRNRQPLLVQGKNSSSDENSSCATRLTIPSLENKTSAYPTPPSSAEQPHLESTEDVSDEESPMNETLEAHFRYLEEGTQRSNDMMDSNNEVHPKLSKEKELPETKKSSKVMNAACTNLTSTPIQESEITVRKLDLSTEESPSKSEDDDTGSEHSMDILEVQETCPVIPESCPNHGADIFYQRNRKPLFDSETKNKQISDNDVDMLVINETPLMPQPEHSLMDRPRLPLEVKPVFAETNDEFVPETIELIPPKENEDYEYQDRNSGEDFNDIADETSTKEEKFQSINDIERINSQSSHDVSTEASKKLLNDLTARSNYEQNSGDTIVEVKTSDQCNEEMIDDQQTAMNANTNSKCKLGDVLCRNIVFDYLHSSELIALKKMVQTSNSYSLRHKILVDEVERTVFVTHALSDGEGFRHVQNLEHSKVNQHL